MNNDEQEDEYLQEVLGGSSSSSQQVDAVLFLIDASPLVPRSAAAAAAAASNQDKAEGCIISNGVSRAKEPPEEKASALETALNCVRHFMEAKIIQGAEKDLTSVLLFGHPSYHCAERPGNSNASGSGWDGTHVLYDFDTADMTRILNVQQYTPPAPDSQASSSLPMDKYYSLANAFMTAASLFSHIKTKCNKRIFLITSVDNPCAGNDISRKQAKIKARDLMDSGITMELFALNQASSLNSSQHEFDFNLFYQALPGIGFVKSGDDGDDQGGGWEEVTLTPASWDLEEICAKVERRKFKKRSAFRISWHLGKDVEVGVKGYDIVAVARKPPSSWLEPEKGLEVRSSTSLVCKMTNAPLAPSDLEYAYPFGGEQIILSRSELGQIRDFGPPGLFLLGFKPMDRLKREHNLGHSTLLVPDEDKISGSSSLFAHLVVSCHKKGRVAICRFIPRQNSLPRLVALIPQVEEVDENGDLIPCAFHIIPLPFADELRSIAAPEIPNPSKEDLDGMLAIVNKTLSKSYHPGQYENPMLATHWHNVQSVALGEYGLGAPLNVGDQTLPKVDIIHKRAGALIQALVSTIEAEEGMSADRIEDGPATKRARAGTSVSLSREEMKERILNGTVTKLTVPILSSFARGLGCSKLPKAKGEIIDLIQRRLA